jgi:hypothetical protein
LIADAAQELSEDELSETLTDRWSRAAEEPSSGDEQFVEAELLDGERSIRALLSEAADADAAVAAAEAELEQKIAAIANARRRRADRGIPIVDRSHRLQSPERLPGRGE